MGFQLGARGLGFVAILALATPVVAQTPPLTSWGKPDLRGVWDFRSLTPMERHESVGDAGEFTAEQAATFSQEEIQRRSRDSDTSERAERAAGGDIIPYNDFWFDEGTSVTTARTSLVIDPPDGRLPPLTPEAEQRAASRREIIRQVGLHVPPPGGWVEDMPAGPRCLRGFNAGPPMTPSFYNNNVQLFQTEDYVVIYNEMVHDARVVPLDGRPHPPAHISQWSGSSRGRWDGETLVVETTNLRDGAFRGSTTSMRLIERFTRSDTETLLYEVTLEDPDTWTRPWTFSVPMVPSDGEIYEYACHEGNYGLHTILAAAGGAGDAASGGSR